MKTESILRRTLAARRSGGFDDQNLAVHPVELAPGGGRIECRASGPVNRSLVIRPKAGTVGASGPPGSARPGLR